jgi:type IV secretory pathway TrbL component
MHEQFYKVHVEHFSTHFQRLYMIIMSTNMEAACMAHQSYVVVRRRDNFFLILVDGFLLILLGVLCDKVICGITTLFTALFFVVLVMGQSAKCRESLVDFRARMECIDFVVMVLPRQKKRKRREAEKAS